VSSAKHIIGTVAFSNIPDEHYRKIEIIVNCDEDLVFLGGSSFALADAQDTLS
jgi:hypothetical protein